GGGVRAAQALRPVAHLTSGPPGTGWASRLPPRSLRRMAPRVGILLAAVSLGYLLWLWREQSRPGTRHYLRGVEDMQARDPSRADGEWFRGTEEDRNDYRCFKQLGDSYARERQFLLARECYEPAARLAPRKWSLWVKLAAAERELGHGDAARAAARRAAELR